MQGSAGAWPGDSVGGRQQSPERTQSVMTWVIVTPDREAKGGSDDHALRNLDTQGVVY